MSSPRRDDEPGGAAQQDIVLTPEDLDDLIEGITAAFRNQADADSLLRRIGYPLGRAPSFTADHMNAWNEVFGDFEQGVIEMPYRRVLAAALRVYRGNRLFLDLAARYLTPEVAQPAAPTAEPGPNAQVIGASAQTAPPTCHVIVRADSEDARRHARELLSRSRLEPVEAWSTGTAISFSVNTTDASSVRRQLDPTDLGWTVVPAGQPDYVYGSLFVEGPDRRRFRIIDAPAQQTFANVTEDFLAENYPQSDSTAPLPTVVEHMREGERHSVNPDSTLHDAGVSDGDELRVGYQTNAGAVHPQIHEDALYRARNQIRDFAQSAAAHEIGFVVRANTSAALLPTEYELEFTRRSYGLPPGAPEGAEPVEIDRHVVSLQLGPEFPQTPPQLWWMTSIFHPNIYPNYDSPQSRRNPGARGHVCLGVIAESWQPALDFGDLCRMLVDMAGFRNYALFELVDTPHGRSLKGNFYDERAAWWVIDNEDRIEAIGGEILFRPQRDRPTYRNTIEEVV